MHLRRNGSKSSCEFSNPFFIFLSFFWDVTAAIATLYLRHFSFFVAFIKLHYCQRDRQADRLIMLGQRQKQKLGLRVFGPSSSMPSQPIYTTPCVCIYIHIYHIPVATAQCKWAWEMHFSSATSLLPRVSISFAAITRYPYRRM